MEYKRYLHWYRKRTIKIIQKICYSDVTSRISFKEYVFGRCNNFYKIRLKVCNLHIVWSPEKKKSCSSAHHQIIFLRKTYLLFFCSSSNHLPKKNLPTQKKLRLVSPGTAIPSSLVKQRRCNTVHCLSLRQTSPITLS